MYKSFKDLALVARKKGPNIKIYQDAMRADIYNKVKNLDKREKLGFLQLQALVVMTKFDVKDKNGKPVTLETDSHGIIRSTFQMLSEQGYLQNYQETYIRDSRLILPKLAFANTDFKNKIPMYNITFERTDRSINFDDPEFRKMFPLVFSKRGLLAKQGYTLRRDEEGRVSIDYTRNEKTENNQIKNNIQRNFREDVKVDISQEQQKDFAENFIKTQKHEKEDIAKEQNNEL